MAELTNEQLLLMEIRDKLCGGNSAELARRLGKDPTYVHRLFYPPDKPGHKGIGPEIMRAARLAFYLPPGFWEQKHPALDEQAVGFIQARLILRNPQGNPPSENAARRYREAIDTPDRPAAWGSWGGEQRRAEEPRTAYGMEPILAWEHPDDLPEGEFVMVPRLDVHLSAGNGHEQVAIDLVKDNPQAFRAEWIRLMRLKPAKLAAMRASGESMEPTVHDGDSLLVDTSQTTVVDGKVYALWYDGGERVKRLFRLPGGGLRIQSDNPRHPTLEVAPAELEHVRVIGRVVHRSGTGGL